MSTTIEVKKKTRTKNGGPLSQNDGVAFPSIESNTVALITAARTATRAAGESS
jgi:hypothetical protein